MGNHVLFRLWFYFRNGWSTYFAFIFAAINTLTVTYFLAIDNYPILNTIFPTFAHYVIITVMIGIPLLVAIGFAHYKRTAAFQAEAEIGFETNPFFRRMLLNTEAILPLQLKLTELLVKMSKNEKLTDEDIKEISKVQEHLSKHIDLDGDTKKKFNIFKGESYDRLKKLDEE
tara:strand:- start:345 stop:860 length:516 start_codon:yes stop_codon:yes gene_type:complete